MRRDEIELPNPAGIDRPGDPWMEERRPTDPNHIVRKRTWSGYRRRFIAVVMAIFLMVTFVILALVPSAAILKPGALSKPHAQILNGTLTAERCSACHGQSSLSPMAWFQNSDDAHLEAQSNQLCVDCHRHSIPENLAYSAHNLPQSIRDELRESIRLTSSNESATRGFSLHQMIPRPAVDSENVACSACHKEHRGLDADLLAVSNEQCQTCHAQRFGAFADSHPDWNQWPHGRGGRIAFSHSTHQNKHFPGWKSGAQSFRCSRCHPIASGDEIGSSENAGDVVRTASYEQSCKECHDEALRTQLARGIDFVALPTLPDGVASKLDGWPQNATGFADGVIPPIEELLLRVEPTINRFIRSLPGRDVSRASSDSGTGEQGLVQLAEQVRELLNQVTSEGHATVSRRLSRLGISPLPLQTVFRSLPPQLVESAIEKWFASQASGKPQAVIGSRKRSLRAIPASATQAPDDIDVSEQDQPSDDDLLGGSLLGATLLDESLTEESLPVDLLDDDSLVEEPLAGDPLHENVLLDDPLMEPASNPSQLSSRESKTNRIADHGGWYRDDQQMSLRYVGGGHADPVLVSWIETFSQLRNTDPLKQRFFEDPVVSECVRCHSGATRFPAKWLASSEQPIKGFTKFSHRPHLNVSALGDCIHCHQVADAHAADAHAIAGHDGGSESDFVPLGKAACVDCHTPKAAGDNCTTCHRYHVGR